VRRILAIRFSDGAYDEYVLGELDTWEVDDEHHVLRVQRVEDLQAAPVAWFGNVASVVCSVRTRNGRLPEVFADA
jgi:hypothetical protein